MHPTAALLLWFFSVLATQLLAYTGLAVMALFMLLTPPAVLFFRQFAQRSRWLLLSLWLILAYGKAGEAVADLAWAPTWEGVAEANLQVVRLLVMLACLAWLLARLGRDGLVSALWGLLQPLRALGIDVERLVVRLALVLAHLQNPLPAGGWKRILQEEERLTETQRSISLCLPRWSMLDRLLVGALGAGYLGILMW